MHNGDPFENFDDELFGGAPRTEEGKLLAHEQRMAAEAERAVIYRRINAEPARNGHRTAPEPPPVASPDDYGETPPVHLSSAPNKIVLTSAEFVAQFTPPDFLLDGILQRGFLYSLTGKTGSGKTAIATLLASSVDRGVPIGDHAVTPGRVLYFVGENPDDVRGRWLVMSDLLGFGLATSSVRFIAGVFKISEMRERIAREVAQIGDFALVVVDTSAAYFEGDDENSNVQAGAHMRRLRGLVNLPGKPTVLVLAHPTKNANDDTLIPRGGGAAIAEVDGNLTATSRDAAVQLHWQGKFRGPDFPPISFQLQTVTSQELRTAKGKLIPSVIARYMTDAAQEELAQAARSREDLLLIAIDKTPRASIASLAQALGWFYRDGKANRSMVQRSMKELKAAKLITVDRGKAALTPKGEGVVSRLRVGTSKIGQDEGGVSADTISDTNGD